MLLDPGSFEGHLLRWGRGSRLCRARLLSESYARVAFRWGLQDRRRLRAGSSAVQVAVSARTGTTESKGDRAEGYGGPGWQSRRVLVAVVGPARCVTLSHAETSEIPAIAPERQPEFPQNSPTRRRGGRNGPQ